MLNVNGHDTFADRNPFMTGNIFEYKYINRPIQKSVAFPTHQAQH